MLNKSDQRIDIYNSFKAVKRWQRMMDARKSSLEPKNSVRDRRTKPVAVAFDKKRLISRMTQSTWCDGLGSPAIQAVDVRKSHLGFRKHHRKKHEFKSNPYFFCLFSLLFVYLFRFSTSDDWNSDLRNCRITSQEFTTLQSFLRLITSRAAQLWSFATGKLSR
jgi:hypothetical protein